MRLGAAYAGKEKLSGREQLIRKELLSARNCLGTAEETVLRAAKGVLEDSGMVLPSYRARADEETYAREEDKLMVLVESLQDSEVASSIEALETMFLLQQRCVLTSLTDSTVADGVAQPLA